MFAKKAWLVLAMTLFAAQVKAEQIRIAYSGVSADSSLARQRGRDLYQAWVRGGSCSGA
jgi:hypothetical protein